jgi:hypothetical protein
MISPTELRAGIDFSNRSNRYISTGTYWITRGISTVGVKKAALFFLEITAITAMLTSIGAVAVPHALLMVRGERALARENELEKIRTAVVMMLDDSVVGSLVSAGPTTDIGDVRTNDVPPLLLKDYLPHGAVKNAYGFTSDGMVVLMTR